MMEVSKVFGTAPYLPDDFRMGKILSTKIDTYSFGVVMYEMVTNLKVYDNTRNCKHLKDHVKTTVESKNIPKGFIDGSIPLDMNIIQFLIQIGNTCVVDRADQRPEMSTILDFFHTFCLNRL